MKEIKCNITNSLNPKKFQIIIYEKSKLIDCYTNEAGILYFDSMPNHLYKIIIISPINVKPSMIVTSFIGDNNLQFNFMDLKYYLYIKLNLVDKNYFNLPIERGNIKLWLDHTL